VLAVLARDGLIVLDGPRLRLAEFSPSLTREEQAAAEALAGRFETFPFSPPSVREATDAVGVEAWTLLVDQGEYVAVSDDVAFSAPVYARLVDDVGSLLEAGESVTVATVRDRYGTSRKYALAFLEHLDKIGISIRVGDERRRGPTPLPGR
jgi:selenocysteine-specific elongation factor